MKKAIVAYDRNRAIGAGNRLPWEGRMKTDMKRVRELTSGNAIIMGRKTFESIGRALPNRQNIVVSTKGVDAPDINCVSNLDDAILAVEAGRDVYIFGGAALYKSALDAGLVDEVLATEIDTEIEGADAFFPPLGNEWQEVSRQHFEADKDNAYPFDFVLYKKAEK